ncbi:MAG: conjugal transfer protein TraN [Desulfobacca sp.]|nr:conjugal transfer protein TraN [Desulfobacca sp.]
MADPSGPNFRKPLSLILTALQVWMPVFFLYMAASRPLPSYAQDRFLDSARQGQAVGRGLIPDASTLANQDENGNINLNWRGNTTTLTPQTLFPDSENVTNPNVDDLAGNDAATINRAQSEAETMEDSQSMTGQAYRTIMGSSNRARVNLSDQPWWNQTDTAIDQVMDGDFGNCEIITTTTPVTSQAHVPTYRTCERIMYPGGTCQCHHDYTVELAYQFGASIACTTDDDCAVQFDLQTNEILGCWGSHRHDNPEVLSDPVDIDDVCLEVEEGVIRTVATVQNTYNSGVSQIPGCDNGLVATLYVHNEAGSHDYVRLTCNVVVNVYHIIDRGWTCDPGCEVLLTDVAGDSIIRPTNYECTGGPCETATQISGAWVNQTELYSTNPFASVGISNLAHEVTITLEDWNQGQMNCWTDPQGEVHCPENTGDRRDTCGELENNPNCVYVRQECIEGAEDPDTGTCYAWTVIYDCGYNVDIDEFQTEMGYMCDGVIRCMGEECVDGQFDLNNTGFARAAGMLQVAQYAASDMDCSDPHAGCKIWTGEHYECKKAMGGWVDCCTEPEGVSIVDYIRLTLHTVRMTGIQWHLEGLMPNPLASNPFTGSWADLSGYQQAITGYIDRALTSAWETLTGSTNAAASYSATIGTQITQTLLRGAYNVVNAMSPGLANSMFIATDVGMGVTHIALTPAMMNIMGLMRFCGWVYTLYQIADIIVHIIWECEQEEFELGAKKQLKVCHYVGSYCAMEVLGMCIEKRESYCCYNSPLGRIMQEQIRGQLGLGWGETDDPDCDGLLISQLEEVNWDQVDLSEWMALLAVSGEYPTQREFTIDGITGSGSQWNLNPPEAPRQDAAERTIERLNQEGVDLEDIRQQRAADLWGQSLN